MYVTHIQTRYCQNSGGAVSLKLNTVCAVMSVVMRSLTQERLFTIVNASILPIPRVSDCVQRNGPWSLLLKQVPSLSSVNT